MARHVTPSALRDGIRDGRGAVVADPPSDQRCRRPVTLRFSGRPSLSSFTSVITTSLDRGEISAVSFSWINDRRGCGGSGDQTSASNRPLSSGAGRSKGVPRPSVSASLSGLLPWAAPRLFPPSLLPAVAGPLSRWLKSVADDHTVALAAALFAFEACMEPGAMTRLAGYRHCFIHRFAPMPGGTRFISQEASPARLRRVTV